MLAWKLLMSAFAALWQETKEGKGKNTDDSFAELETAESKALCQAPFKKLMDAIAAAKAVSDVSDTAKEEYKYAEDEIKKIIKKHEDKVTDLKDNKFKDKWDGDEKQKYQDELKKEEKELAKELAKLVCSEPFKAIVIIKGDNIEVIDSQHKEKATKLKDLVQVMYGVTKGWIAQIKDNKWAFYGIITAIATTVLGFLYAYKNSIMSLFGMGDKSAPKSAMGIGSYIMIFAVIAALIFGVMFAINGESPISF